MTKLTKLTLLVILIAGCAWGQMPAQEIKVAYQLIPTPAAMLPSPTTNIGVLVIVQTAVGSIGKIEVRLDYYDATGIHEAAQTVSRALTPGGFDPSPIPVLFTVPVQSIAGVYAEGYAPALIPQLIVPLL